ncbi:MAG: hypothetical protein CMP53_07845 [Flavobacteriales bacterium]|nr:hypothetical protein [Flavobacteriales bacterium]|tara:strand:- start:1846 stop:3099 length:1254 start_codon:yes stop_codon:yes gene_type:complete
MKKLTFVSLLAAVLLSCGSQKAIVPEWVHSKPIDQSRTYVYGVGMSYINPNAAYQQAARSNALADLAGEVESQIFDETKLLQKEDIGGFSSAFSSETSTKSHIKLEEYEVVETYSDELRYYVLYKLDLPFFLSRKAENDALAASWIKEKLLTANESSVNLTERFHALADAIDKAIQRDFLMDPKFKVETQTSFISALRNIENDIHANLLVPENTFYLGLPEQFSAILNFNDKEMSGWLDLRSSSGRFSLSSHTSSIGCNKTGNTNSISLEISIDFNKILPQNDRLVRLWLKEFARWKISQSVYFQHTLVSIQGPTSLKKVISEAVSTKFTVSEEAPLKIAFRGEEHDYKMSNSRNKHVVSGNFVLTNHQGDILWSSNQMEKFGISSDKEASRRAAYAEFSKDIQFFILPQMIRNLNY